MKKQRITVSPRLQKERARLRYEIEVLEKELLDMGVTRGLRLELRGVHTDVDSVKHMVRGLFWQMAALTKHFKLKPPTSPIEKAFSDVAMDVDVSGKFEQK